MDQTSLLVNSDDKFKKISESLLNDSVFVVNFFRNFTTLFSKIDLQNKEINSIISKIVYGLLIIYKHYQTIKHSDKALFKELNIILKQLVTKEICK